MIYKCCVYVGMYRVKHEQQKYFIRYITRRTQLSVLYVLKTVEMRAISMIDKYMACSHVVECSYWHRDYK